MKQFEIHGLGLEEMTNDEMMRIGGGNAISFFVKVAKAAAALIGTYLADKALDAGYEALMQKKEEKKEEDIYDATFDGGTLEPAYCIASQGE